MKTFTAGKFEVEVRAPSPAWITVRTTNPNGEKAEFYCIHPEDMPDLLHALTRALAHANQLEMVR